MYSGSTRVRSVSSIRSTNVPPVERANAQSYRAVRTLPTCRSPLGEGANRTLTPPGPAPSPARRRGQSRLVTGLVSVPMFSMVTDTSSPSSSGPTPAGVPVSRTSPGSSVITLLA